MVIGTRVDLLHGFNDEPIFGGQLHWQEKKRVASGFPLLASGTALVPIALPFQQRGRVGSLFHRQSNL